MGLWRVVERLDERTLLKHRLHDAALNAPAAAMDQAHFAKPGFPGGAKVFLHHRRDVPRRECVQIERVLNGNPLGHSALISQLSALSGELSAFGILYVAVT